MKNKSTVLAALLMPSTLLHAVEADFSSWALGCDLQDGAVITLPKGVHHTYPDNLPEKFLHISNNDDGMKRILFDLSGKKNITIDGNGAELRIHGRLIPFFMKGAEQITIRNLIIDWEHPFFSQAEVVDSGKGWFSVRFQAEYPVEVHKGELLAVNPDVPDPVHFHNVNFIDTEKGEQVYQSADEYRALRSGNYKASQRKNGVIRIKSDHLRAQPAKGQIATFQYVGRTSPAIAVHQSDQILIENVTQYHAGAIANIFEGSSNIFIRNMVMQPRPGSGRWFSALNDATHFVDCSGAIEITDSLFEFQGDDAANIHGIYRVIEESLPGNGLRMRLVHRQQLGVDTIQPGDTVRLCSKIDYEVIQDLMVKCVHWKEGGEEATIYFETPLPDLDWDMVVATLRVTDADVLIARNRIQNNRARGLLIKTLGRVRIQDNYFHTPGAAVKLRVDASNWYESGPVDNVEISGNVFDQCKFGGWSKALFEIDPSLGDESNPAAVMKNIRIHNNQIIAIFEPLIVANNVENLEFYDNELSAGTDYPHWARAPGQPFVFGTGVKTGKMQKVTLRLDTK